MIIVPEDHIEGIFNYCTRRCESCAFTARCTLYQSEREYERRHPNATWQRRVHDSFAETFHLLEEWCRREGIDFEQIRRDAQSDETRAELQRADEDLRDDPLQKLATTYSHAAFNVVDAMATARALRRWPSEVETALDTISWNAGMVGAKVHRALHGMAQRHVFSDEDPVQNDWNGSAKLTRLLVAESKRAWEAVMREGEAPGDSPLLELVALLDLIDAGVAERFPQAMAFVRPGFDEVLPTRT
ncbi:MAG TPA: hypothetical protein VLV86_04755 [Vicinamibacterales bacterium]|nr:hypothetical protein [Vicinamibacterales bacterium]